MQRLLYMISYMDIQLCVIDKQAEDCCLFKTLHQRGLQEIIWTDEWKEIEQRCDTNTI